MSRLFYRRRFLNRRGYHAGAYVIGSVSVDVDRYDDRHRPYVDAELTIADCGRVVRLAFDADTQTEARNALHKARLLRDILDGFVDALEVGVEEAALPRRR